MTAQLTRESTRPHGIDVVPGCRFCGVSAREDVLAQGDQTIALPSVGSLVEGWLLLIPIRHTISLAELPTSARSDFIGLADATSSELRDKLGPLVQFEHGPSAEGRSAGCGVDHAHLHVVPTDLDLRAAVAVLEPGLSFNWRSYEWPWEAERRHGADYLFVRDQTGQGWFAEFDEIPSQLFRQALARHFGMKSWDWKDVRTVDETAKTRVLFQAESQ